MLKSNVQCGTWCDLAHLSHGHEFPTCRRDSLLKNHIKPFYVCQACVQYAMIFCYDSVQCAIHLGPRESRHHIAGPQSPTRQLPRPLTDKDSERQRIAEMLKQNPHKQECERWWVGKNQNAGTTWSV